jgi:glyoxylase-like metal-dependent hydrolase (beta-lactamase superfamily II)
MADPATADQRPAISELGDDVYAIDTRMAGYDGIVAGYLIRGERPCLVETGTASSAPEVQRALDALGIGATELATIVVTHIHLDHAGGVGDVARDYPNATVVVHERGARHLVDPERLVASARQVFGAAMDRLFGSLRPTDADRISTVGETGSVDLGGGRTLTAYHSPGHAQHHVGLLDSATGDLYVGDAAGIYIPELDLVRASTPPPDFDLEAALASLDHFAALAPRRLLFSHFGPVSGVADVLGRAKDELIRWVDDVRDLRASAADLDHAAAMVRARTAERYARLYADAELDERYETLSSTAGNVAGISRYLDRRSEKEAADPNG